jgi:hypothetical protein
MEIKQNFKTINNLKPLKIELLVEENKLIVHCEDLGLKGLIKSYYLNFWDIYADTFEEQVHFVMKNGFKYHE